MQSSLELIEALPSQKESHQIQMMKVQTTKHRVEEMVDQQVGSILSCFISDLKNLHACTPLTHCAVTIVMVLI